MSKFNENFNKLLTLSANILNKAMEDISYKLSPQSTVISTGFQRYSDLSKNTLAERSKDFEQLYHLRRDRIMGDLHGLLMTERVFVCPADSVFFDIAEIYRLADKISQDIIARFSQYNKDIMVISKTKREVLFPDAMRLNLLRVFSTFAGSDLDGKISELEIKLGLKTTPVVTETPFGPPGGITNILKNVMSGMGIEMPKDGIPSEEQFGAIAQSLMSNEKLTSIFQGVVDKTKGGDINEIIGETANLLKNPDFMNTIQSTVKPTIEGALQASNQNKP